MSDEEPYLLSARHRRWVLHMTWHDVLFAHWPIPASVLRGLIPEGLELETFDRQAWIGVVPFRMTGVRPPFTLPLPWLSAFLELNVRTYVRRGGKSGVWFFSLDAANPVAVRLARALFYLPYFDARMSLEREDDEVISYRSERRHRGAPHAGLVVKYCAEGSARPSVPGTIEHFLTERYCLFAADGRGRIWRADIDHVPWPLQAAEADIISNHMTEPLGVELPSDAPALLHFARRQEVLSAYLTSA